MVIIFKKKNNRISIKKLSLELYNNIEVSIEENEHENSSIDKQTRQRLKRQPDTDAIPLVEFHDALSQSTTLNSDTEQRS
jgi:hypothetical protein